MAAQQDDGGAARRILVVEDEFLVADHIASTLEDLGYVVVGPVPTIEDALAVIANEPIDCALLDANLDGVSSSSIAEALIERGVPFIVCTGYGLLTLAADILNTAPRLTKPFRNADLAATLGAALAR